MNLRLLQIADSALPISGYTHSWGLEAAIARGLVHDAETLERWTRHWLRASLGPLEGVLVASACRAGPGRPARRPARAERTGRRLDHAPLDPPRQPGDGGAAARPGGDLGPGAPRAWPRSSDAAADGANPSTWHHPVAFGLLGALAGGEPEEVLTAYLHQAALGMVGGGRPGHPRRPHPRTASPRLPPRRHPKHWPRTSSTASPETAGGGCPYYEILCDEQTRLYARMFRS